jgi:predicted component of type VI protein secretion system
MKLSLVVMTAGNKMEGKALDIKLAQFLVGRDPQCHLRPASPLISKRHCALIQRDGRAYVRDFDSTNGTFVNDEKVTGEVELQHGDRLKIGPLLFGVKVDGVAPVNRPTPPPPTKAAPATKVAPKPAAPVKPSAVAAAKAEDEGDAPEPTAEPAPAEPSKPAAKEEPLPATVESPTQVGLDDDVASMLLALQDETGSPLAGEVPEGSTVHDVAVTPDMLANSEPGADGSSKDGSSKDSKSDRHAQAKAAVANTSQAAESILKKYMRRARNKEA